MTSVRNKMTNVKITEIEKFLEKFSMKKMNKIISTSNQKKI